MLFYNSLLHEIYSGRLKRDERSGRHPGEIRTPEPGLQAFSCVVRSASWSSQEGNMSRDKREPEYPTELESQFILRLPEEPAVALREVLRTGENLKNRLTIKVEDDMRHGEVRFDHWLMHAKVVDLPTITESLKTIDNKSFYKTADVSQMMICKTEPEQSPAEEESPAKNKKKDPYKVDKKFLWPHGLTPPTKNIRKRRFRKTLKKKCVEAPEIEKEVKRLLRADNEAVSVTWEILTEDDDVMKHEVVNTTKPPKPEKKKRTRSSKKESKAKNAGASNVVEIFGGAVSDSDAEDGNVNIEVEETQLLPQEFAMPTYLVADKVQEGEEPIKGKKHRSKKNKDKKKSKKKNKDKDDLSTVTSLVLNVDTNIATNVAADVATIYAKSTYIPTNVATYIPTNVATYIPTNVATYIPTNVATDVATIVATNIETDVTDVETTVVTTEQQVQEDVIEYQEPEPVKDSMTLRIEQVGEELEVLKLQKQRTQNELIGLQNESLRQRFLENLHTLNQEVMYKEMEYQGLITLQNSDEI